jgi:hypothetical protein
MKKFFVAKVTQKAVQKALIYEPHLFECCLTIRNEINTMIDDSIYF